MNNATSPSPGTFTGTFATPPASCRIPPVTLTSPRKLPPPSAACLISGCWSIRVIRSATAPAAMAATTAEANPEYNHPIVAWCHCAQVPRRS